MTAPIVHTTPETQQQAVRYLRRTGNTDLIPMLGLDGAPIRVTWRQRGHTT